MNKRNCRRYFRRMGPVKYPATRQGLAKELRRLRQNHDPREAWDFIKLAYKIRRPLWGGL